MSVPEISVIIPNFNRHDVMERAVESVLAQRGVDFELVVVDDASERPPRELYRRIEAAGHRVLRESTRRGPGPSRNRGAEVARGRYLALLDSDDCWLPGKLSRQLAGLRACGLRVGQTEEIWYRNGVEVKPLKAHRAEGGDLYERSLRAICVSPSAVLLERELFWEMGGFDPELFVCEDYDLWLRVAAKERFDLLPEPLVVKYGGHHDQLSKALPVMDRFRLRALAKGLERGAFGPRWEAARRELVSKAEVLAAGATKRGRLPAVELANALCRAAEHGAWEQANALSWQLLQLWPTAP